MCKQITSHSFKNMITYKLFIYKSFMDKYLIVCEAMTDVKLDCQYYKTILEAIQLCPNK